MLKNKISKKLHKYFSTINSLNIFAYSNKQYPTFQLLDQNTSEYLGKEPLTPDTLQIMKNILIKMHELNSIEEILLKSQRQGRISFFMTSYGEEAAVLGSVAALNFEDTIFPQYREMGALYWRGFTLKEITDSCVGNYLDCNKSHQMPIHFTCKRLNYFSISSPLATQISQAAGFGYGLTTKNSPQITVTYFGEGSSSEGDFYTGVNFAQTLSSQVLFFNRNNYYAISTPYKEQSTGDGTLGKAIGLGMNGIRVDGNDALAVFESVKFAREFILKEKQPFYIEAMTYRIGDHSTSDHSLLYREQKEIDQWNQNNNPKKRLFQFLLNQKVIEKDFEEYLKLRKEEISQKTIESLKTSFKEKLPPIDSLFEDVYDQLPQHLQEQNNELLKHMEKFPDFYDFNKYHKVQVILNP